MWLRKGVAGVGDDANASSTFVGGLFHSDVNDVLPCVVDFIWCYCY